MNQIVSLFQLFRRWRIDRQLIVGWSFVVLLSIVYLPLKAIESQATPKKLIEYGWNAPTPNFFRKHIKEMEQRPFDGVMLKLNAGKEVFNKDAYPDSAFTQDRVDLAATKSTQLTDNFVVMWSGTEKGWDWFSDADWAAAAKNIQNFAKTSAVGNLRGIAFDSESYTNSPWQYQKQPQRANKTLLEYQQQVRKRGAQFMRVLQAEQSNVQLLTFGLLSWMRDLVGSASDFANLQQQLAKHTYGLWPAFINGMLDAAQPGAVIIDGHEWAYYFSNAASFETAQKSILKDTQIFVDPINQVKYTKQVKLGQAVFFDLIIDLFPKNIQTSPFAKTMHIFSPQPNDYSC